MSLRRQSTLFMTLTAVAVAACLAMTFHASHLVAIQARQAERAEVSARAVGQFTYLIMETVLFNEKRSQQQWRDRSASFRIALDQQVPQSANQLALLARQHDSLNLIGQLYNKLVDARSTAAALHPDAAGGRDQAFVSELFLATNDMADDAFAIARLGREELDSAQQRLAILTLVNVLLLGGAIGLGGVAIRRRVLRPIVALNVAMEAVARGDLAARTGLTMPNELGQLAATFDRMAARLLAAQTLAQHEATERALAQRSLEESMTALARARTDLQTIIDQTPALVVYFDRELRNRFANHASHGWFAMSPEQMQGQALVDIVGRTRFATQVARFVDVLAGQPALFEQRVQMPSGLWRYALFSYLPDWDGEQVKGFYGFVSDVTPLREAEAAQAESTARLQSIVDAAHEFAIVLTDASGLITLFSPGAEAMLGFRADQVVGLATPLLLHDAAELNAAFGATHQVDAMDYAAVVTAMLDGAASTSHDWTYRRSDGSSLPVNVTVSQVHGAGGDVIGYLSLAKDVHVDRLHQGELIAARDRANAASEAKSLFLANMSHEIRTPMNAVIGLLQLLGYTELSPIQRDYTDKVVLAAKSLLTLLNDILDLSRIEADAITLEQHPFEPAALARELSDLLHALIGDKDLDLIVELAPALPRWLRGDAMRLRQVLINLAGNAIKFTPAGEVRVALGLGADGTVTFCVSDTGIGIAEDKLATIFEQFHQAEASTTRRFGGTGLGLAISQRLVRLMGGQLTVASTPGHGSRFEFKISLAACSGPAAGTAGQHDDASGHIVDVLIVDDDAAARMAMANVVKVLGWRADGVGDGQAALARLAAAPYDVVLLDWRMPVMDGWELTSAIARQALAAPPVVIMMSAYGRAELNDRMRQASDRPHGFVSKPVTASQLLEAVALATPPTLTNGPGAPKRTKAERPLASLRVLVVDDNALNLQVAQDLLVMYGATVVVADGGLRAIELASAGTFDAILMDIQMPDLDGYETTRRLRAAPYELALPILAMTANAMPGDREAALGAGMNAHLSKPIDIDAVVASLLAHCLRRAPAPVPGAPPPFATHVGTKINLPSALRRLGGQVSIYLSLSAIFTAEFDAMLTQLRNCFAAEDWTQAANLLHSFKSSAGIIGADELQQYAADLEATLRSAPHACDCDAALAWMAAAANDLAHELALIEQANLTEQPALAALLDELDARLLAIEPDAASVVEQLLQWDGGALAARVLPLAAAIARHDFNQARLVCAALRESAT